MNGRGGIVTFFIFLFLSIIILLQILSMLQSERFYEGLNRLDEIFEMQVLWEVPVVSQKVHRR